MMIQIRGLNNSDELIKIFEFYPKVFLKTPINTIADRIVNDSLMLPCDIRIAEENDNILSSITIFKRNMNWGNKVIKIAGIGNVSTIPEKRKLGLASQVMNDVLEYIDEMQVELSILFTGINKYYEKFKFFTIPSYHLSFEINRYRNSQFSISNYSLDDLDSISKLYDSFNQKLFGTVYRDIEYWKANLKFADKNEVFIVARRSDTIDGYLRFVPDKTGKEIWEFGYYNIEAFNALILEAGKMTGKKILKTAALCPKYLVKSNTIFNVTYESSSIAMASINQNSKKNFDKKDFNNFCFWWTDNF